MSIKLAQIRRAALNLSDVDFPYEPKPLSDILIDKDKLSQVLADLQEFLDVLIDATGNPEQRKKLIQTKKKTFKHGNDPRSVLKRTNDIASVDCERAADQKRLESITLKVKSCCTQLIEDYRILEDSLRSIDRDFYRFTERTPAGELLLNAWPFESLQARDELLRSWDTGRFGTKKSRKLARAFARHATRMSSNPIPINRSAYLVEESNSKQVGQVTSYSHVNFSYITMQYEHFVDLIGESTRIDVSPFHVRRGTDGALDITFFAPILRQGAVDTRVRSLRNAPSWLVEFLNQIESGNVSTSKECQRYFGDLNEAREILHKLLKSGLVIMPDFLRVAREENPEDSLGRALRSLRRDKITQGSLDYLSAWKKGRADLESISTDPIQALKNLSGFKIGEKATVFGATGVAYCDTTVVEKYKPNKTKVLDQIDTDLVDLTRYCAINPDTELMRHLFSQWLAARSGSHNARNVLEDVCSQGILALKKDLTKAAEAAVQKKQSSLCTFVRDGRESLVVELNQGIRASNVGSGTHHLSPGRNDAANLIWDHVYGPVGIAGSRFGSRRSEPQHAIDNQGISTPASYAYLYGGPQSTNIQKNSSWIGATLFAPGDAISARDREKATYDVDRLEIRLLEGIPRLISQDEEIIEPVYSGYLGRKYLPTVTRALLLCNNVAEASWSRFFNESLSWSSVDPSGVIQVPRVKLGKLVLSPQAWILDSQIITRCTSEAEAIIKIMDKLDQVGAPSRLRYSLHETKYPAFNAWDSKNELPLLIRNNNLLCAFDLVSRITKYKRTTGHQCNITFFEAEGAEGAYAEDWLIEARAA